jgi:UDP-N-acetylmuramyl pentapeptide phosphotransferase/UDP-N-acetylglucosamine-1-phosphate transferase
MTKLIISFVISVLSFIFTIFWIIKKQPKKSGNELVIVSDVPETSIMGGMLIAVGFLLLIAKYINPSIAGTDEISYNFAAILGGVCVVSGSQMFLNTFVKKVVAYDDRFEIINMVGKKSSYDWKAVTEIKTVPLSLRATFIVGGESVSINGRAKEYGEFISIARNKIPATVGSDVLGRLYNRITKQGILKF